jgi:hypothetical protein
MNPWSFGGGAAWTFTGPPVATPIVNYGHLQTAAGGSLFLIAKQIDNHGTIDTPGGTAALVDGQEVLVSQRADGLSLSVPVKLPAGSVNNQGQITADAGQILLQAQTVNNSGELQANSVRQNNGVIELCASQDIQLAGTSVIQANGDAGGNSPGGNITINSSGTFSDTAGSQISAAGGAGGGNGGNISLCAPNMLSLNSSMNANATPGFTDGTLFLDPTTIDIAASGTATLPGSGTELNTSGSGTLTFSPNYLNGFSTLDLQASSTISLQSAWTVPASSALTSITLQAGTGGISVSSGDSLTVQNGASITLVAGANFNSINGIGMPKGSPTSVNKTASGSSITLSGTASVTTTTGNITAVAGNGVTVGSGGIVTGIDNGKVLSGGGGSINIDAVGGNVNCGTGTQGYSFSSTGATVSPTLTGISTAAGGNVTIQANGNITAPLPQTSQTATPTDNGSGAFGAYPGNVTLLAGGNVTGHYVLADGVGSITAGGQAGTDSTTASLALSLVNGGWTVNATGTAPESSTIPVPGSIYLSEVRNPDGMLDGFNNFTFNYSPLASVTLNAAYGAVITGASLLRLEPSQNGSDEGNASTTAGEPVIFPPSLTINAGPGGIALPTSKTGLTLFPSPEGTLNLTTTGGGNVGPATATKINGASALVPFITGDTSGSASPYAILTLSDSLSQNWQPPAAFTQTDPNGNNPLMHLNDPNPVMINISGSISDLTLFSPKPVEMYAAVNINNTSANIVNLNPSDTTSISAGGEIFNQDDNVILNLPAGEQPDFAALAQYEDQYLNPFTGLPSSQQVGPVSVRNPTFNSSFITAGGTVGSVFKYDPATGQVSYTGNSAISSATEQALLAMPTPFLPAAIIEEFYTLSQAELGKTLTGYQVAGPGTFKVSASSIDLGTSDGLISLGIGSATTDNGYALLAPYTTRGADLDVTTSGNLSMLASSITSEYGGAINLTAGGAIEVGSPVIPQTSVSLPLGIISLWQGDITVIADGDINVDGSRIASYDGGNIFVESLQGNVNAGTGADGSVQVTKPYVNKQGQISLSKVIIPGSGILAASFPQLVYGDPVNIAGNITVETPEGNIEAGKGGIVQLALAPGVANEASLTLEAGSRNTDGSVAYVGSIDASGSGIVGGKVNLEATGNISGLVIASVSANVAALQNVSATVLSSGSATVSAGGTVSGSVVGLGAVSVSGASDVAAAFSASSVSTSGAVSGAAASAAPSGSSSAAAAATSQQVTSTTQSASDLASNDDDDLRKKKAKSQLMEYVGRVRVLLPE